MLPKSPRNYMPASTNHCFFLNGAALSFLDYYNRCDVNQENQTVLYICISSHKARQLKTHHKLQYN